MVYWDMPSSRLSSLAVLALLGVGTLFTSGCSTLGSGLQASALPMEEIAKYSPAPQVMTPFEAMERARKYVQAHPGADYSIGSGDSMLPLYRDHAVIVTERPALNTLRVGQTVVFMGGDGIPVAHALVARTEQGWVTRGLGNGEADPGTLSDAAYMGVVVQAYQPTGSVILAYARSARASAGLIASNP